MSFLRWFFVLCWVSFMLVYGFLTNDWSALGLAVLFGVVFFVCGALARLVALATRAVQLLEAISDRLNSQGG